MTLQRLFFALSLTLCLCLPCAAKAAQRIVSLDLCTDWMLARHAEPSQVAALSPMHRRYPAPWLTKTWPFHDGRLERILEINPDLIITGQYNALQLRARLKTLGFRVEILPLPTHLAGIHDYETRLLSLIGQPVSRAHPPPGDPPPQSATRRRLLLLGANGIGTGQGTFENGILLQAGWQNYLLGERHLRLDLEQIMQDPPEAILWAAPPNRALANRFAEHPALKRVIPPEHWLSTDYWRWQCPGPWTWELIEQLKQWHD